VGLTGANGNLSQKIARRLLGKAHVLLIDDYSGFCAGVKNDPLTSVAAFEGCLPDDGGGSFEHVDGGNLCTITNLGSLSPSSLPQPVPCRVVNGHTSWCAWYAVVCGGQRSKRVSV
jgi:hypothetical protein